MLKYKIGQRVTIPANKPEGLCALRATVVTLPDKRGLMTVRTRKPVDEFEVAVDDKTGKILPDLIGPTWMLS